MTTGTDASGAMIGSALNASNSRWLSWKTGHRLTISSSDPVATPVSGVEDRPGSDVADDSSEATLSGVTPLQRFGEGSLPLSVECVTYQRSPTDNDASVWR